MSRQLFCCATQVSTQQEPSFWLSLYARSEVLAKPSVKLSPKPWDQRIMFYANSSSQVSSLRPSHCDKSTGLFAKYNLFYSSHDLIVNRFDQT